MISPLNENKKLQRLLVLIERAEKIAIVVHSSPDGDAMGSSTAFAHVLERMGKQVHVVTPDMMLEVLRSLPGAKDAVDAVKLPKVAREIIEEADLIVCLDFNQLSRIDRLARVVENAPAPKVLIDHHLHPADFAEVCISHPEMSSTCFLLFKVLCGMGLFDFIDKAAAESLLAGMMTDTGNFSYNCADPDLYIVVAELVRKGADKEALYRRLFATHSLDSIRLGSYALLKRMEVWPEYGAALICLSRKELNEYHYSKGDTEGLVNKPLEIPGIRYCAFLREEDGYVKVSMRSLGTLPVNEICRDHFGGGGHINAAGGEFDGSLDECARLFRTLLPVNKEKYLSEK